MSVTKCHRDLNDVGKSKWIANKEPIHYFQFYIAMFSQRNGYKWVKQKVKESEREREGENKNSFG